MIELSLLSGICDPIFSILTDGPIGMPCSILPSLIFVCDSSKHRQPRPGRTESSEAKL